MIQALDFIVVYSDLFQNVALRVDKSQKAYYYDKSINSTNDILKTVVWKYELTIVREID